MKASTINEIKKALDTLEEEQVRALCLRLAKYKKDNKELLTYLLFEADNEHAYVEGVKADIDEHFQALPASNLYYVKKGLRKILRLTNKQIRYSGLRESELEIRIYFCTKLKNSGIPWNKSQVILNLYQQQLKKINGTLAKLPEDLQYDYQRAVGNLA